jgi:hypothetical protein
VIPALSVAIVLLVIAAALAPSRPARALGFLLAWPVGSLAYFLIGIGIARWLGVGRFYSIPLGGEHIGDWDIVFSLLFWIACATLAIQWVLRRAKRTP